MDKIELDEKALTAAAIAMAKQESLSRCKSVDEQLDYERRTWPRILSSGELEGPIRAYLSAAKSEPVAVAKWEIDNSAGSPILTYEKCSVIQDEQAHFVMGLIRSALASEPANG